MNLKSDATLNVVRSFIIISIGLSVATVIFAVYAYIRESTRISTLAAISTIIQTVMMVVALSTYFGSLANSQLGVSNLSWSYATGWAGVAFYLTAAAAFSIQAYALRIRAHQGYTTLN